MDPDAFCVSSPYNGDTASHIASLYDHLARVPMFIAGKLQRCTSCIRYSTTTTYDYAAGICAVAGAGRDEIARGVSQHRCTICGRENSIHAQRTSSSNCQAG